MDASKRCQTDEQMHTANDVFDVRSIRVIIIVVVMLRGSIIWNRLVDAGSLIDTFIDCVWWVWEVYIIDDLPLEAFLELFLEGISRI